jgi:Protein of unknown function (DUF2778)
MWIYEQATGAMIDPSGKLLAIGYSGNGPWKNNPADQNLHNKGPIPAGKYKIEKPIDTKTHGPFVLWLIPDPSNQMYGRSAFGIHGDSVVNPGTASEGCVIQPRYARQQIAVSGDDDLEVVATRDSITFPTNS